MIRDEAPTKRSQFVPCASDPRRALHLRNAVAPRTMCQSIRYRISDIEESLRLLDEIWPREKYHEEQFPRQFGRFSILGELGRGGFGVVYLAEDPLLGRKVALKLPRVEVLSGTEGWRRFLREARAASRLDHPNLIPLLDAGTIGPVGYIVSAFVPGPSLEQWLRHNRGECSPRWAAQLVKALALAIEHAHQKDVLHRDLKPANVLLHAPECERRHARPSDVGRRSSRVLDTPDLRLRPGQAAGDRDRRDEVANRLRLPSVHGARASRSATRTTSGPRRTSMAWERSSTSC